MLHAVHISFFLDPQRRGAQQILEDWWLLTLSAEMVANAGARVTVIQACHESGLMVHRGIDYHFVAPVADDVGIVSSPTLAGLLHQLKPDIVHVHGLNFAKDVLALRRLTVTAPLFLQDHADRVPRLWRRPQLRRALATAAGVSFCAMRQAEPFRRAGVLNRAGDKPRVFEIPEGSSLFTAGDQATARATCGLHGDPAILWVGHLNANKDPLTVLRGIRLALDALPDLQLWCCYGSAPLESAVRALLNADSRLADRVHLIGQIEHSKIETLMRAADLFVLGSHHEGSGVSLIEAMATGLSPVVTDIASFRALTGNAQFGALWPCDDAGALSRSLISVAARRTPAERDRVLAHFAAELSPPAVGKKFVAAYSVMIAAQLDSAV